MDCNRETILDELNDFEKKRPSEIPPILDDYLVRIAKTGDIMFPWNKLRPLFRRKLEIVLNDFYETCPADNLPILPNVEAFKYEVMRSKLMEALDSFQSAPFTIQRLCELVTNPRKHYRRTDKFMRGLEKNILVVSTIEPKSSSIHEVNHNGNNAVIVNGLISNSSNIITDNSALNSNLKDNPPLDNFASVFSASTIASTVTATMEVEVSSMTQDNDINSHIDHSDDEDINHITAEVESTVGHPVVSAMDISPDISDDIEEKVHNQIEPCTSSTVNNLQNVPCSENSSCGEISSEVETDINSSSDTQIVPENTKCILEEDNPTSDVYTESHNVNPNDAVEEEEEKTTDLDVESTEIIASEQISSTTNLNLVDPQTVELFASSTNELEVGSIVCNLKEIKDQKKQEIMETEASLTKEEKTVSDEAEPMEQD
ncbi:serine/threonine-protein phosphatase 4 regulatory subunit 2-A-like isoform X1 [Centruroides sculpturatus]|uniref:serine/threonine-protein phosphatase 4 regulatory subunit 2-A-like isoform X1 n=1 Tax=Centruroides sculpturatus TaxID=218467 RepID=UPI000C6D9293|nr:serine/threonine-protein phosphatase 4 regulatory subunit 2-A-like isoform X1 [Centruroides sculpturatus]